ncbi:MAG: pyridoxamine 5'-phosphate oxidase family protein [Candidatus Thorarchaeota archaeon]
MKQYPQAIKLQEIWSLLDCFPLAQLATIDNDQPRVRPMTLVTHNGSIWFSSKSQWSKVEQIQNNEKVEFTLTPKSPSATGSIRFTAIAVVEENLKIKEDVAKAIPWFSDYWNGADDPNFTLIKLKLNRVLYDNPFDGKKYTVELS